MLDFLIDDTTDVKQLIRNVSNPMGALNFIWGAIEVTLKLKIKSHEVTPLNLLLWSSKNWSNDKDIIKIC